MININVGHEESKRLFKRYVKEKYEKLNYDYQFEDKLFDALSDPNIGDINDWVLSGKLKDLLDKNGSQTDSKKGHIRLVDLHPRQKNKTQSEAQKEFADSGKKVVERATIDKSYTTFCINFHNELEGILADFEDDIYLIRVMSLTMLSDSLIYIIKKGQTLEDMEVTVNRIPNSALYGKRMVFVDNNDVVGIKAFLSDI